jgi:hypothetical protein
MRVRIIRFANLIFTDSQYSYSFVAIGASISIATAGQTSTFSILLIDTFAVGHPQRSGCDQFIGASSNFGDGEQLFANSSSHLCQNGTYILSYNVTKAGRFAVSFFIMKG